MDSLSEKGVAATLPIQPMPIGLHMAPAGTRQHPQTVIGRSWREGDPARCRLCASCSVNPTGFCIIVADGVVDPRDAALFRMISPAGGRQAGSA